MEVIKTENGCDMLSWCPEIEDKALEQMVAHEIGHMVEYKINAAKMGGYLDETIEKTAKSITREWTTIYNANKSKLPSSYAQIAGRDEGFAEVFSIYRIDKTLLDDVFVSYMDKVTDFVPSFGG